MGSKLRFGGFRAKLALAILVVVSLTVGGAFFAVYRSTDSELRAAAEDDLVLKSDEIVAALGRATPSTPDGYRVQAEEIARSQPVEAESVVIAISLADEFLITNQPDLLSIPGGTDRTPGAPGRDGEEIDEKTNEARKEFEETRRFLEAPRGFSEQELDDLGDTLELTRTVVLPGAGAAVVRVGKSLKPTEETLEELGGTFLRLGIVALLVSAALAWFLAARLTRPLRKLTEFSGEVGEEDLAIRVPLDEAGTDEVRSLAISFNQMLDRLEDSFDRQKAFVADASHDLRTPLTIVRGQIEVLARNPDPSCEEVEKVAGIVGDAVGRMERLVDDLLILARSESRGEAEVQLQPVGPLLEAEREGRLESERGRIEIGSITAAEARFDRDAISRAVSNLVENALRYSGPEGKVVLSAESRAGEIVISVDDDGPGIPPADRDRIFDRFARLDRARSSDTGGSGLGLAIVRTLIEAGGGRVSCSDSELGGARFSIYLPRA